MPTWVTPLIGIATLVAMVYGYAVVGRCVTQIGPPNLKQRARLGAAIDAWPAGLRDAVVRWHDYPALTKLDVTELLHERCWFYAGQDFRAPGWPLFVTRDLQRAESPDRPPDRRTLLRAELRRAGRTGRGVHVLDLTPYQAMGRAVVVAEAKQAGWSVALRSTGGFPIVNLVRPGLPDVDQWAGRADPGWARIVRVPGSDDEPNPASEIPRVVQRKINSAAAVGFVLLTDGIIMLSAWANPVAVRVLLCIAAVVVVPFVVLTIRARRAHLAYRSTAGVGRTIRRR